MYASINYVAELFFPREDVIELQLVTNLGHFALYGFVDRNAAVFSLLPDLPFLFACGVDTVMTGSLLGAAELTADVACGLLEFFKTHERFGVDGDEEVTEVIGNKLAVLLAGEHTEVVALLERCGLLRFARIMTRLCERYLGLLPCQWTADAPAALVDAMLSDVLEGGNFQSQHEKRPFADVLTDAYDVSGKGRNSLFRNYICYLKKYLRQRYPWAKSKLWLPVFGVFLPARWGVRVLLGKRKKVNLMHAAGMAREREKLLREFELYR